MEKLTKTGAKKGKSSGFRHLIRKFAVPELMVYPIPGLDFYRSKGIFLDRWFTLAENPRNANVLLISGSLSQQLARGAAVIYLQMPRPRLLVFAGVEKTSPLPEPDVRIELTYDAIKSIVPGLSKRLQHPYREDAESYQPDFIREMMEENDDGSDHHHHDHEQHGSDHGQHQDEDKHEGHNHEHSHNNHEQKEDSKQSHHQHMKGEHGNQENGNDEHQHQEHNHGEHQHGGHDHGGHDHGGGGMGFMSMVAMTKDMPRATDGLPMERNQTWFGPFFPGLPGGLAFQFTLDGDTVVKIKADKEVFSNFLTISERVTPELLQKKISEMNPLAANTCAILIEQLLKKSRGEQVTLHTKQIALLEQERILSHLNWLTSFGSLVGNRWLEMETAQKMENYQKLHSVDGIDDLIQQVFRFTYLKNKLQYTGVIPENLLHHTSGSIARAAGMQKDERQQNEAYEKAGFEPVVINENNAWGRLKVRLLEIRQSLDILNNIETSADNEEKKVKHNFSLGQSTSFHLEGPSGEICADLHTQNGRFDKLEIIDASAINTALAVSIVKEMELSDALITIASLDINPFMVAKKHVKHKKM